MDGEEPGCVWWSHAVRARHTRSQRDPYRSRGLNMTSMFVVRGEALAGHFAMTRKARMFRCGLATRGE